MESKSIEERLDAIEKRLNKFDELIGLAEQKLNKSKTQWLDGPIMMFGKHDIKDEDLNKRETE